MVSLAALWLPILLSALAVFLLSSVIHMVLGYHKKDYDKLPDEAAMFTFLSDTGTGPGNYVFPHAMTNEERKAPDFAEKATHGPVGNLTVMPGFHMGKMMGTWLALCFVVTVFVAYLATQAFEAGAAGGDVFRFVSTATLLGFGGATGVESIWMGRRWSTTFRHIFDAILYCLAAGGIFSWLWPA